MKFIAALPLVLTLLAAPAAAEGRIIITEIMYNPASEEAKGEAEWIEIANVGDAPVEIKDWRLDDEDTQSWADWGPFSATLPPGAVAVLINEAAVTEEVFRKAWGLDEPNEDGREKCLVIPVKWGSLANTADDRNEILQLKNSADEVVCEVNYHSGGAWPTVGRPDGPSIYLIDVTAEDLNNGANWRASRDDEEGRTAGVRPVKRSDVFNGNDLGSPGFVPGLKAGEAPVKTTPTKPADNEIDY